MRMKLDKNCEEPPSKKIRMNSASDIFDQEGNKSCKDASIEPRRVSPRFKGKTRKTGYKRKLKEQKMKMKLSRVKPILKESKYKTDELYKTKQKAAKKTKYKTDDLYRSKIISAEKTKYKTDDLYQSKTISAKKTKYKTDDLYRSKIISAKMTKYKTDNLYRSKIISAKKTKYKTDDLYRSKIISAKKTKYKTDDLYRSKIISAKKTKYKTDDLYRSKIISVEKTKYKTDDLYRSKIISAKKTKYKTDDLYRSKIISAKKTKYKTNDIYQSRKKRAIFLKYNTDPNFRLSHNMYHRIKYKCNALHRNYMLQKSRLQVRQKKNLRFYQGCKDKYLRNVLFRAKKLCALRLKYRLDHTYSAALRRKQKISYHKKKSICDVISKFQNFHCNGPEYVCSVCLKLLFRTQVLQCHKLKYKISRCISEKYLHVCTSSCSKDCMIKLCRGKLWICYTCHRKLKQNKVSSEAWTNNLQLNDIPDTLLKLNSLECHLISQNISFMKIVCLPKGGQFSVKGPVVSVPSNMSKGVSVLPRQPCDDQLVRVKLKRKLSYKGYYEYRNVNTKNVMDALQYLKKYNKWYHTIDIDAMWTIEHTEESETVVNDDNSETVKNDECGEELDIDKEEKLVLNKTAQNETNKEAIHEDNDKLRGLPLDSCLQEETIHVA